jgi:Flp pilus assembly protein TadG
MGLIRARTTKRRTRGMAMVEMVLVLPVLLLVLFAIMEFGLMFSRWLTLSNAVREGARLGIVYQPPGSCVAATVKTNVQNTVVNYAKAGGLGLTPANVTVTGACAGTGNLLTVGVANFPFKLNIPFYPVGSIPLSYTSIMRNE